MAISMRKPAIVVRLFDLSPLLFVLLRQKTGVYVQYVCIYILMLYFDSFVWNLPTALDFNMK